MLWEHELQSWDASRYTKARYMAKIKIQNTQLLTLIESANAYSVANAADFL